MALRWKPPGPYDLFGGKPVRKSFTPRLVRVMEGLTASEKALVKASVAQGWAPASAFSGTTHVDGAAVDLLCGKWPKPLIRKVVLLFQKNGCQAVLRVKGEKISGASPISITHIHAVMNGYGNWGILARVTGSGGFRHVDRELSKLT